MSMCTNKTKSDCQRYLVQRVVQINKLGELYQRKKHKTSRKIISKKNELQTFQNRFKTLTGGK